MCYRARVVVFALSVAVLVAGMPRLAGATGQGSTSSSGSPAPEISAAAAVLMDWKTGKVLYSRNAYQRRDIASTTKIMTAVLALEMGNPTDLVVVSQNAGWTGGSTMKIREGQEFTLLELLHGLMLPSGNDAAVAIAEHIGGSEENFAWMMTRKAWEIGAWHTRFENPHGMTETGHYSTAYDLALIARYALRNWGFARLVSTTQWVAEDLGSKWRNHLENTNQLLWTFVGADGVKTGTTDAAGKCLVASATRDGRRLITVVLDSRDRWRDAAALLEYGFLNYPLVIGLAAGERAGSARVRGGMSKRVMLVAYRELSAVVDGNSAGDVRVEVVATPNLRAPIRKGQPLGLAFLYADDRPVGHTTLVAETGVDRRTLAHVTLRRLISLFRMMARWGVG